MLRSVRGRAVAAFFSFAVGAAGALAPTATWIEARFGFDPDGASGLAESWFATIPIAIGIALVAGIALRARTARRSQGGSR